MHKKTFTVAAADGVRFARVRSEINFLLIFETAPFFCKHPVNEVSLVGRCEVPAASLLKIRCLRDVKACVKDV
jgi:hypothetical protein